MLHILYTRYSFGSILPLLLLFIYLPHMFNQDAVNACGVQKMNVKALLYYKQDSLQEQGWAALL